MNKSALLKKLAFCGFLLFSGSLWAMESGSTESVAEPIAEAVSSPVIGDPVVGKQKALMCKGCHNKVGYKTAYPKVYQVPRLGGQHAEYLVSALGQYRSGERNFTTMQNIASSLSDQDIADMAAYYSSAGH